MKNLFKVTTTMVDGYDGGKIETFSYILSDEKEIMNEKEITQEDVMDYDTVFLSYDKFENIGEVTNEEIETLVKFGVVEIIK